MNESSRVDRRPIDPATHAPIGPLPQPGYYPGYSTLAQRAFWDATTRALVIDRVESVPPIRFFTDAERRTMDAVCERLMPQDDRDAAHRIPIVPSIDRRLYDDEGDGYRYAHMPPDREAYRRGLAAIDAMAQAVYAVAFHELDAPQHERLLRSLHDGAPLGPSEPWESLPVNHFWMMLVTDCVDVYYAHPYAWDEIGFGGPAYPRAYMRLERGEPETWERAERRYAWEAPAWSVSGNNTPVGAGHDHHASPSQGGTH